MRYYALLLATLAINFASIQDYSHKRAIRYSDIASEFRGLLSEQGIKESNFDKYINSLNQRTVERETEGENDHLIYFILQSERFTRQPRIEPALSAYGFVQQLRPEEKSRYLSNHSYLPSIERLPAPVSLRFHDFIKVIEKSTSDERLSYFRLFLQQHLKPSDSLFQYLYGQYARAMKFLYQKEFVSRQMTDPQHSAAFIAPLYQDRGHSTDTQIEANFAVYIGLAVLKSQVEPMQLNNVLIVGPGLDFAPRTDLMDIFNPQSYQPFAIADALINLKLADPERLRIHCVDINDRVVNYLQSFSQHGSKQLSVLSGVADSEARPLSSEYKNYFQAFGKSIGAESGLHGLPENYRRHLKKSLTIRPEVAARITAEKFNIITERYEPSPQYDLLVVTNVFPYFNTIELLLSLTNIKYMMRDGGYLIHNESRPILFSFTKTQGLPMVHSRTVLIAPHKETPLYDTVSIHKAVRSRAISAEARP